MKRDDFGQEIAIGDAVIFAGNASSGERRLEAAHVTKILGERFILTDIITSWKRPLRLERFVKVPEEIWELYRKTPRARSDFGDDGETYPDDYHVEQYRGRPRWHKYSEAERGSE
jgi:hypothetical protein